MTPSEKIALVLAGISARYTDYLRVKAMQKKPLREIQSETGYSIAFIAKCRKIAGWRRGRK